MPDRATIADRAKQNGGDRDGVGPGGLRERIDAGAALSGVGRSLGRAGGSLVRTGAGVLGTIAGGAAEEWRGDFTPTSTTATPTTSARTFR